MAPTNAAAALSKLAEGLGLLYALTPARQPVSALDDLVRRLESVRAARQQ